MPKRRSRSSLEEWMQLGVQFLARRDRTAVQVERYLLSKGASSLQARQIVRRLSDLHYLNDCDYAQRWIDKRLVSRPMGQERLKVELRAKGIAETLANQVIADVFREINEEALACRALKAARCRGRRLTRSQTVRFLHQRGFSEETIDRMIEKFRIDEESVYEEQRD